MLNLSNKDNTEILELGTKVFKSISKYQKNWNKKFFINKLLKFSILNQDFKVQLFRLIDVLPSLRNEKTVAKHIDEYLVEPAKQIHPLFGWFCKIPIIGYLPAKLSEIILRSSVRQVASSFIAGKDSESLAPIIRDIHGESMTFTIDLLGEYVLSEEEALAYQKRYLDILNHLEITSQSSYSGEHLGTKRNMNISIKLTALYSQCSNLNFDKSVNTLIKRLTPILSAAKTKNCGVYFDAEDKKYNAIILKTFKSIYKKPEFQDFYLPGIVVQAYDRNAIEFIQDLISYAKDNQKKIALRLVKGAYWDHEQAVAAQANTTSSLFQNKAESDANYEYLANLLLENIQYIYPAFASHNIRSLTSIICQAKKLNISKTQFELQMLYGMARPIALSYRDLGYLVRLYLPVGEIIPGMGYLVRRLLENTANDSFLKQSFYDEKDIAKLLVDPNSFIDRPND